MNEKDERVYLCVALPPRLQIVKDLSTAVNCLTIKQLLDQPKYQPWFALFYRHVSLCVAAPVHFHCLTIVGENRHNIK